MQTHEEKALGSAVPHKDVHVQKSLTELLQRGKGGLLTMPGNR